MGLFDEVRLLRKEAVCSQGHDLTGTVFQTKDLGQTMGQFTISTTISGKDGGYGYLDKSKPFLGRICIYGSCEECPALIQDKTFNLIPTCVEFEIDIVYGKVKKVVRTSKNTTEQLIEEKNQSYMKNCIGPVSYQEAVKIQRKKRGY